MPLAYTIELNGYDEPEHWAALNEKNVYLSYTADFGQHVINHMHKSCEILLVEQGGAEYTINGVAHQLAPSTLFVMGGLDAHKRVINEFPFVRYGLTLMPNYLESLPIVNEHLGVYRTQSYPDFLKLTNLPDPVFDEIRGLFLALGEETAGAQRGRSDMVYALLLQLTIVLTRLLNADRLAPTVNPAYKTMLEIRDYIDACYSEPLSLEQLARQFLHQLDRDQPWLPRLLRGQHQHLHPLGKDHERGETPGEFQRHGHRRRSQGRLPGSQHLHSSVPRDDGGHPAAVPQAVLRASAGPGTRRVAADALRLVSGREAHRSG